MPGISMMQNMSPRSPQQMQPMNQGPMQPQPPQQSWLDWFKSGLSDANDFTFGTSPGWTQLENFTPEQQQILSQLLQGGFNQIQNPTAGFYPIRNEAMRQFNQDIVPGLLERFTAGGGYGSNALSSPALGQLLGSAGAGLSSNLAAQQAQYGLASQGLGLKQAALGLQNPYQYASTPGTGGLVGGVLDLVKGIGSPILQQSFSSGASIPSIIKKTLWG